MRTSFDKAMSLAKGVANRKRCELVALTYQPGLDQWIANYASPSVDFAIHTSYVEIEDGVSFERHCDDYDENLHDYDEEEGD